MGKKNRVCLDHGKHVRYVKPVADRVKSRFQRGSVRLQQSLQDRTRQVPSLPLFGFHSCHSQKIIDNEPQSQDGNAQFIQSGCGPWTIVLFQDRRLPDRMLRSSIVMGVFSSWDRQSNITLWSFSDSCARDAMWDCRIRLIPVDKGGKMISHCFQQLPHGNIKNHSFRKKKGKDPDNPVRRPQGEHGFLPIAAVSP